jgi:periplasmic protein TonB
MSTPAAMPATSPTGQHHLSSDLYRSCLPQASNDPGRVVVWVNAMCACFLTAGILGVQKPMQLVLQPFAAEEKVMEVRVFQPQPNQEPPPSDDISNTVPEDVPQDFTPVVPTAVVADPSKVNFAVPVQGPTIPATMPNLAGPPPRNPVRSAPPASTGPRRYTGGSGAGTGRFTPDPSFPREALIRREQGTLELMATIGPDGSITELKVSSSSGSISLDTSARQYVRRYWRFLPEDAGEWIIPIQFKLPGG